jgi:hypothetical protein
LNEEEFNADNPGVSPGYAMSAFWLKERISGDKKKRRGIGWRAIDGFFYSHSPNAFCGGKKQGTKNGVRLSRFG